MTIPRPHGLEPGLLQTGQGLGTAHGPNRLRAPSPNAWANTDHSRKHPRKMALIRESRGDRSRSLSAETKLWAARTSLSSKAGLTFRERSVLRHRSRGLDAAQV